MARNDHPKGEGEHLIYVSQPKSKKKRQSKNRRTLRRVLIVALAGLLLWYGYTNWESIAPDSVLIWFNEMLSGGERGDGYPVDVSGESVVAMQEVNGALAVLNDSALLMYNTKGGEVVRRTHAYADPAMSVAGKYMLITETGGTRFRLETQAKTLFEQATERPIITAAVGENGTVAVLTEPGESYVCEVVVFNAQGKEIYRRSRVRYTVDVAVSPNGKNIALAGVTAENGVLTSYVEAYALNNSTEALYTYSASDVMLCALEYLDSSNVMGVTDAGVWFVHVSKKKTDTWSYGDDDLLGYTVSDGRTAVVTRPYGETDGGRITVLNNKGEDQTSVSMAGEFRHMAPCNGEFLILTDRMALRVSNKGLRGQQLLGGDSRMIGCLNRNMVVLGLTTLNLHELPTELL